MPNDIYVYPMVANFNNLIMALFTIKKEMDLTNNIEIVKHAEE